METHFNIGKIYTINSYGPSWGAKILGGNECIQIPKGTEVVLLKESKGKYDHHIDVVILMPNGTICWTTVSTAELHKWKLTTE